mmetsp:Transcript_12864/g.32409  ORF Transcript_12864/g.32409 Transcript_12864/m.32409 type:complete len:277 (+) Transcript_12864:402-1232(+)
MKVAVVQGPQISVPVVKAALSVDVFLVGFVDPIVPKQGFDGSWTRISILQIKLSDLAHLVRRQFELRIGGFDSLCIAVPAHPVGIYSEFRKDVHIGKFQGRHSRLFFNDVGQNIGAGHVAKGPTVFWIELGCCQRPWQIGARRIRHRQLLHAQNAFVSTHHGDETRRHGQQFVYSDGFCVFEFFRTVLQPRPGVWIVLEDLFQRILWCKIRLFYNDSNEHRHDALGRRKQIEGIVGTDSLLSIIGHQPSVFDDGDSEDLGHFPEMRFDPSGTRIAF